MEKKNVMAQEIFDAMVDGAIEDLRKCGLDKKEIFNIIKEHLGLRYADKLCR
ncbi:MAG: hypothetical protein V3W43_13280 [Desulfatiglandaceae bacterium]|jgi:hypothetical protein